MKKTILVWPANTEIGLEIGRALQHQKHFEVTGASSGPGPADFIFNWSHWYDAPDVNAADAAERLKTICKELAVDFVYPAHDQAAVVCADAGIPYIGAPPETVRMCRSKRATYEAVNEKLPNIVPTAYPHRPFEGERAYMKPNIGQGGKGHFTAINKEERDAPGVEYIATRILPGPEYTIDCLTDKDGILQFVGARKRNRVSNGICIESQLVIDLLLGAQAKAISNTFNMRGAWFFQTKEDANGIPSLLEISVRPAGSSGLHRANGVNLPLLACYDACGIDVDVMPQNVCTVAYRSLQTHYRVDLDFDTVYCDVDDTLIMNNAVNPQMLSVLLRLFNDGKSIKFLSRGHGGGIHDRRFYDAGSLLGAICDLIPADGKKSNHITGNAIFIDDSHAERKEVHEATGIPVFSPEQAISIWGN